MLCSLSNLETRDLDQIKSLEGELNQTLLAFSCHDSQPAVLDQDKLAKLQALEKELGIYLVAVG